MSARSFCTMVNAGDGLARTLAGIRSDVPAPSGGILFVSGAATLDLGAITDQVRSAWKGIPTCIVPAAGVITERNEIEGAAAASGLLWSGGKVLPVAISESSAKAALRDTLSNTIGKRAGTVMIFPRSDFTADMLDGIRDATPNVCLFGAGTVGGPAIVITAAGETLRGRAGGLAIVGAAPPLVESASACRLISPLRRIDQTAGGLVLKIDGSSALDLLSSCVPELRSASGGTQPVVFAALADEGSGDRFVVRPVRGIDPTRRGVMVGAEAQPGMRLGFAIRDAAASKAALESAARGVSQQALGAAPRFAIYLSCAGRGQGLYGAPDVEARILRQRFGDLPIAGMHSAFELSPWGPGEAKLALYTGVLALFRSPS